MTAHLHHAHLFAADIDATIRWWTEMLGAEVAFDGPMGGARNVFLRIGEGRLHLYDQPLRDAGRGAVHHLGVRTDDLRALTAHMERLGADFPSGIREFGSWRYAMVEAPDGVLLELFEVDAEALGGDAGAYFSDQKHRP